MQSNSKERVQNPLAKICLYVAIGLCVLYAISAVLFYVLTRQSTFYGADGSLNFLGRHFLLIALIGGGAVLALSVFTVLMGRRGRMVFPVNIIENLRRYGFLIRQLVRRDFKTKYKRSVLGVLWSFLNPLLMMSVQYIVFSTIFRSAAIPDFAVYLMLGIVLFNFFSESSTMGLSAITTNASLINKAYVPKYIYPLCKVISSLINLGFSLIPLTAVILVRGVAITPYYFLLLYVLVCMLIFSFGISLFLSALMVFFRDIQFLWGVILTVWTYITPLFYDANALGFSEKLMSVYRLNPLYQFITFARTIVLNGASPDLFAFIACAVSALVALLIGCFVFAKTQKKFVLYL